MLGERPRRNALVVAVGNPYRSDDGIGPRVAKWLRITAPSWVTVVEHDGEPAGLLDTWDGADVAVVIDAARSEPATPGRIHRVDVDAMSDLRPPVVNTHAAGPAEAVALGHALGRLPPRLVLYGVEGQSFLPGVGLSPEVEASIPAVAERILAELLM